MIVAGSGLRRVNPWPDLSTEILSRCVLFPFPSRFSAVLLQVGKCFPSLNLIYRKGFWEVSHLGFQVVWSEVGSQPCYFDLESSRPLEAEKIEDFFLYLGESSGTEKTSL